MTDPYPDELKARDHLDGIIGKGRGDPDTHQRIVYIGEDRAVVERSVENPHWSELPKGFTNFKPRDWYEQDNAPESPLEADLEDNDGAVIQNSSR